MAWALGYGPENPAVKLHLHFDVLKAVPCQAAVTPAACSETGQLEAMLQPGRLYVVDRGYADYELFAGIVAAGSSLVARVKDSTAFTVETERPLGAAARKAGVVRDVVLSRSAPAPQRPFETADATGGRADGRLRGQAHHPGCSPTGSTSTPT